MASRRSHPVLSKDDRTAAASEGRGGQKRQRRESNAGFSPHRGSAAVASTPLGAERVALALVDLALGGASPASDRGRPSSLATWQTDFSPTFIGSSASDAPQPSTAARVTNGLTRLASSVFYDPKAVLAGTDADLLN